MEETLIEKSKGWVITSADQKSIYDFTFARTRTESIKKWENLWERPNNWKAHYYQGHRCVKAEMTIKTI